MSDMLVGNSEGRVLRFLEAMRIEEGSARAVRAVMAHGVHADGCEKQVLCDELDLHGCDTRNESDYLVATWVLTCGSSNLTPRWGVRTLINLLQKRKLMAIVTVGIDLAKSVFAVHGVNATGKSALVSTAVFPAVPHAISASL